ncbi:MAG: flagellar biosynthetic protein FliO [Comamonadaceae bacterium]
MSTGNSLQVIVSLALVLALVGAVAWLLKRFSAFRAPGSGLIRVVAGVAVGQRERIVLVEVDGTWLLVGVAPGQVRALHTMPKALGAPASDAPSPEPKLAGFASWLSQVTQRRSHE